MILEENPRGLGVVRDELSGWLSSFNQYKGGKGADGSQWLELHRGGMLIVDRKTAERRTIYVPRAAASITGTIQPGVIRRGYGKEQFENGMVARTLFAMPPARRREWNDQQVQPHTQDRVAEIYASLASLAFDRDGKPIELPLSPEAQEAFIRFVDEHGVEQATLGDDRLEAAWSKLEGYGARLALVIHLVRCATGGDKAPSSFFVDHTSISAGIKLARWFGHEAKRVYADMGTSDEDRTRVRLIELIESRGGRLSPRELTRSCRAYVDTEAAETALNELVGLKLGRWEHPEPSSAGGRPQKYFVLVPLRADIGKTPEPSAAGDVSSAQNSLHGGSVSAEVVSDA